MKADLPSLARTFLAAAGLTCADEESVTRGLVAVFKALEAPRTDNEIRRRRLDVKARQFFAAYERETGVTKAELTAPAAKGGGAGGGAPSDPLTRHREAFVARLLESEAPRFTVGEVAAIMGRDRKAVRNAYARHLARGAAAAPAMTPIIGGRRPAKSAVSEGVPVVSAERRRAYG